MEDEEFLGKIKELALEMDKLADEYEVRDRLMSVMVIGLTNTDVFGDTNMSAVYAYNLNSKEELEELTEFMKDTYQPPGPNLDDLLGGLGISLN